MTKKTDHIENYLNAVGHGWCIKYLLVAVVEDEQSDQSFYIQTLEHQTAAETIGLCEAVSHIQKTKIANAWLEREAMIQELEQDDEEE